MQFTQGSSFCLVINNNTILWFVAIILKNEFTIQAQARVDSCRKYDKCKNTINVTVA
jgi:hypothetical protein